MQITPTKEKYGDEESAKLSPLALSKCSLTFERARNHFVKFFLDVSYFMCMCPYRIVEIQDGSGDYLVRRNIFQQLLCATVHFLGCWDAFNHFRLYDFRSVTENPKIYFQIFTTGIHFSVIVAFCYTMWTKSDTFCRLVHMVQRCPIISSWYPKWINWVLSIIATMHIVVALLSPIFVVSKGQNDTWENWYDSHVDMGRHCLFLGQSVSKNMTENTTDVLMAPSKLYFGFPQFPLFLLSYFLQTLEWIYIAEFSLIMLVMSLTLYCATNYFTNALNASQNCKVAIRNYEALKTLSSSINTINGAVTLTYTVDCIMYYATHLHPVLTEGKIFSIASFIGFFIVSLAWLHFASYTCLLMDRFREWVRSKENRNLLPSRSISIILLMDEIATNVVGMSGYGLFTVNYKFVAQAMTTLMTYFIIQIQFKQNV